MELSYFKWLIKINHRYLKKIYYLTCLYYDIVKNKLESRQNYLIIFLHIHIFVEANYALMFFVVSSQRFSEMWLFRALGRIHSDIKKWTRERWDIFCNNYVLHFPLKHACTNPYWDTWLFKRTLRFQGI